MNGIDAYNEISTYSEILGASNYRQIQLLIEKLQTDLNKAMLFLNQADIANKCKCISRANNIVSYLRECLDFSADPALCSKLDKIYAHLEEEFFIANSKNNLQSLKNCKEIVNNLKIWWDNVEP